MQQVVATLTLNPSLDRSSEVEQVVPERKLRCAEPAHEPGGGGINVARAIRRLGGEATAAWASGGATGELLRALIEQEQVPQTPVPIDALTRQNLMIHESSSGQEYRFGFPGAHLTSAEVDRCCAALRELEPRAQLVVLSGSLPPGVPADLYARIANESAPARVVVDTSGDALRRAVQHGGLFLIKPNKHELEQLAGDALESDEALERAARRLVDDGQVEVVMVSLGAAGVLVVSGAGAQRVRSPTVQIRSKVGAGDSTVAGVVLGLARDWELPDAVRLGVAAGAAAVMTPGSELCRREDAERLLECLRREACA